MDTALTIAQLAKLLNISKGTIRTMIKEEDPEKRIPYIRIGKNYRFFPREVAKFFNLDPASFNLKD